HGQPPAVALGDERTARLGQAAVPGGAGLLPLQPRVERRRQRGAIGAPGAEIRDQPFLCALADVANAATGAEQDHGAAVRLPPPPEPHQLGLEPADRLRMRDTGREMWTEQAEDEAIALIEVVRVA